MSDPGATSQPQLLEAGLENLKRKFSFLSEYSDEFIKSTGVDVLIKAETASRKLIKMDKDRKAEDKLFQNREALSSSSVPVVAGSDNRLDIIHPARFLPGATCSATNIWLMARKAIGSSGHQPLSTYDMASIGLGGSVTAKGWVELHNPSSPVLSIKMFSMGSCVAKSKQSDAEFPELEDLSEFKAALRVLRGAMAFVHPWNRSIDAIENFYIQNNYCSSDLAGTDKQALLLSQFTDYVLVENSSRWRGMESFLDTRSLRYTWADFIGQKQLSSKQKNNQPQKNKQQGHQGYQNSSTSYNKQNPADLPSIRYNMDPKLFQDGICVLWNLGKCLRPQGMCSTKSGRILKHICNHRPDPSKPDIPCGKDHMAKLFH